MCCFALLKGIIFITAYVVGEGLDCFILFFVFEEIGGKTHSTHAIIDIGAKLVSIYIKPLKF